MGKEAEIRQALGQFAARYGPTATLLAEVSAVDSATFTCTLDDDGLLYEGVRLRPVLDGKESLTLVPKVGSWALAVRLEDSEEWMLISAGEFDKVVTKVGTTVLEQDASGFLIKKGNDSIKQLFQLVIDSIKPIMVLYGNNPDFVKLLQAETMNNNLFK